MSEDKTKVIATANGFIDPNGNYHIEEIIEEELKKEVEK